MSAFTDVVDDLEAEHAALDALVAGITESDWRLPTPADGWDVADSITHLSMSDGIAVESVEGRGEDAFADALADPEAALRRQDADARSRSGADVLATWRDNRSALLRGLRSVPEGARLFWGIGEMSAASFTTARLMECWAHGLDCFAALKVEPVDTDRLRHVCHLGYRTLPYAFDYAHREPPAPLSELRLELTAPDGSTWRYGAEDAPQVISGPAGDWARLAVRRLPRQRARLTADGSLADAALDVVKAYLF